MDFWFPEGAGERTEWGQRLDCEKQGCDLPHSDNGAVYLWFGRSGKPGQRWNTPKDGRLNNHATTRVMRTITYSEWEAV